MTTRQRIAGATLTAIALTAAGCTSTSIASGPKPDPAASAAFSSAAAARSSAAAAVASAASAAASPSDSTLTGPVGTTYTVTGDNGPNGATTTYDVTMTRVTQHASLGQYESLSNGSDHVTAAEFKIAGNSGQTSDDANSDAVAVGSDGQDYTPAFDTITEGTNFDNGDFRVGPGQSVTGWVTFELPAGVSVASVQWSPGLSQAATWQV